MSGLPPSPLSEIFGSTSAADLIVFLVYNHDRDFSVQEMADRTKISKARVSKMKEGLLKYGVIKEHRKVGKVSHYRYDRNSRFGKLVYDFVFATGASDRAVPAPHVPHAPPAPPAPQTPKDKGKDEGGKIIIA